MITNSMLLKKIKNIDIFYYLSKKFVNIYKKS